MRFCFDAILILRFAWLDLVCVPAIHSNLLLLSNWWQYYSFSKMFFTMLKICLAMLTEIYFHSGIQPNLFNKNENSGDFNVL